MKVYADSSFIVALYLQQQSSPVAAAFMRQQGVALPFTPWHRLEVRNAIRLSVFHRVIDSYQAKIQLRQVEADLRQGVLIVHEPLDWVAVLRTAEKLGAAHNESMGCRSADLFHIASAIEWEADHFLTFDERQKKMAKAAGLAVKN
ncbi:MAG: type II toxin-antitoxin system VapC family toxin [Methylacidiphilales bacterium]|nr:type II toxin-antitoxin system VapC family toxin [Candidatus Methylacidiphilales bacterium]